MEFNIADHTEDCDLICSPKHAGQLLNVLRQKPYEGARCQYRGSLGAPLDQRWLLGGYTAHFHWPCRSQDKPFLDVFGVPPRVSSPWQAEVKGSFAGRHTVAEMKRTNRRNYWDQATALGIQMLKARDKRAWLHIFDGPTLTALLRETPQAARPGPHEMAKRPVLHLALEESPLLARAIQTEIDFWTHLDRIRLQVYAKSAHAYGRTVSMDKRAKDGDIMSQHEARVEHAEKLLPQFPLKDYGVKRIIEEAREATAIGLDPVLLRCLPEVTIHFESFIG